MKYNLRQILVSYTFRHRGAVLRDCFRSKEYKRRPRWNDQNIEYLKDIQFKSIKLQRCGIKTL